ncbi:MAG: disulfide bond formation protein B [Bacteroidales bacterium]|jgi:disulfide bond formation protein DsbB|nr:disulfide bond formation protein B [Bacteroidales bacterium]
MMNKSALYIANSTAILAVSSILTGAFFFQFVLHEDPCPLCLLQRMGMMGVIFGLSLNTFFGLRKEHFGIVILAALAASVFSVRQILLHIAPVPGEPTGFGSEVFGMHLYTWAALIFMASIIGSVVFLFLIKDEAKGMKRQALTYEKVVFYLIVLLTVANFIATFFECQLGPCCEDGPCP